MDIFVNVSSQMQIFFQVITRSGMISKNAITEICDYYKVTLQICTICNEILFSPEKEGNSDRTKRLHFHALEKDNGNPLLYSCLGNPMDRGAQQGTVHGAAQS